MAKLTASNAGFTMPKREFMTILTLQAAEGKQAVCLELLRSTFDDPSLLEMEVFQSWDDPEILLAVQKWSSYGVFQEYLQKVQETELFKNTQKLIEFIQVTNWKSLL